LYASSTIQSKCSPWLGRLTFALSRGVLDRIGADGSSAWLGGASAT
jgi:hypothetical protein